MHKFRIVEREDYQKSSHGKEAPKAYNQIRSPPARPRRDGGSASLRQGRKMSKSAKLFDELFPSTSSKFDVSALHGTRWLQALSENDAERLWLMAIWSDDLLKACASFREASNLFVGYKFVGKLSLFREALAMATRKSKPTDPVRVEEKAEWVGFLDYRLTDEHLAALDAWKPKPQEIFDEVDAMLANGYRFTLSYNKVTKLASVTVIDDDKTRKTGGYALSSGDADGALALKMAVYKHVHALDRNWEVLLSLPSRRGQRG